MIEPPSRKKLKYHAAMIVTGVRAISIVGSFDTDDVENDARYLRTLLDTQIVEMEGVAACIMSSPGQVMYGYASTGWPADLLNCIAALVGSGEMSQYNCDLILAMMCGLSTKQINEREAARLPTDDARVRTIDAETTDAIITVCGTHENYMEVLRLLRRYRELCTDPSTDGIPRYSRLSLWVMDDFVAPHAVIEMAVRCQLLERANDSGTPGGEDFVCMTAAGNEALTQAQDRKEDLK